jgi:hypothetical protein
MKKTTQFGERVAGYDIPVLNEREIRAAAGLLFLVIFMALMLIAFKNDFLLAKYAVTVFMTDFIIRVFVSPRYAPSLIIGRLIVSNQVPEYVGARQKKFAWTIGVLLSGTMFLFMVVINSYSPITGLICLMCLIFLFFESAFGICLACKAYAFFMREKVQYCPGEVCDPKSKHPIQKTSPMQLLVVLGCVLYIFAMAFLFNDQLRQKPYDLFGTNEPGKSIDKEALR